ncbi:15-hydroxyprostaglandin dehydrogenase [Ilyonectria destructans]|nr:15-hydroxyprostaglandin dehydrogenase [Ilyonectria destructans]
MSVPVNEWTASPQKVVLITGGVSGIGLGMVRYFASEGYRIAVLDMNTKDSPRIGAELASEFPKSIITFRTCDVSSWEEQAAIFKDVYDQQGRIDVVMANAGISEQGTTSLAALGEETPSKPRLQTLDVNLTGVIYSVKLAIHYMQKNTVQADSPSRGLIICTASNAGIYPFPVAPLYAASKAGVISLVRSMARPLERANIQINALAPAVLETNIAPSKDLFKEMIVTPMSTLTRGVANFIADPTLTGAVAEIHGPSVTLRDNYDYVDEDSKKNLETFWSLGYA